MGDFADFLLLKFFVLILVPLKDRKKNGYSDSNFYVNILNSDCKKKNLEQNLQLQIKTKLCTGIYSFIKIVGMHFWITLSGLLRYIICQNDRVFDIFDTHTHPFILYFSYLIFLKLFKIYKVVKKMQL